MPNHYPYEMISTEEKNEDVEDNTEDTLEHTFRPFNYANYDYDEFEYESSNLPSHYHRCFSCLFYYLPCFGSLWERCYNVTSDYYD